MQRNSIITSTILTDLLVCNNVDDVERGSVIFFAVFVRVGSVFYQMNITPKFWPPQQELALLV
jgi:hypothetical protein